MDCGGLVCRQRYTSRDDCLDEQYGRDANDRAEECTYNVDAGGDCLRLLVQRTCADPRPTICDHIYDVCEK